VRAFLVVGWLAGLAPLVQVQTVLELVVLVGAATAAAGVIYAKIVLPVMRFCRKAGRGVDILLEMPDWRERIEARVTGIEERLRPLEMVQHQDVGSVEVRAERSA